MGVIWDQYDTYVCHLTLSHDSRMGKTYVLHIINLPDTDVWQTQMHMTFATLKSSGKSHMCHMSLSYLTHILHSHIRHIYISNMGVISDRSDIIYVCHVTLSHDSHMGNSYVLHIVYLPDTSDMTDANANDFCYIEVIWKISSYVSMLPDIPITF